MARRRAYRRRARRAFRRGGRTGGNVMGIITRSLNPIFSLLALDIVTRQIDTTLLSGTFGVKIPVAARAAISLGFNLFRLKISSRFVKGLPFGLSTFAGLALRLSALQIALGSLPVFFDPKNYLIPTSSGYGFGFEQPGLPGTPLMLESGQFNVGDFVRVTAGADTGKTGSITSFDGSRYSVSGIQNVFLASEITRV